MAKRWVIGGLAVGVGALVVTPEARTWLRRRLGLEPEDRRWFEEEGVEAAEHEGDEPLDTRESRYSLRARLAEEGLAEPTAGAPSSAPEAAPAPEPSAFPAFPAAAAPSFPAFEGPAPEPAGSVPPEPDPEPATEEPAAHAPYAWAPSAAPAPADEPVAEQPAVAEPAPAPAPEPVAPPAAWTPAPASWAPVPAPPPGHDEPTPEPGPLPRSFEAVPALTPEADAPRAPGEDTNEIEPVTAEAEPAEEEAPPPPPTLLRPATTPQPSRPFGESASFRSAIDAARERVHGAARDATPAKGEDGEEPDRRS